MANDARPNEAASMADLKILQPKRVPMKPLAVTRAPAKPPAKRKAPARGKRR